MLLDQVVLELFIKICKILYRSVTQDNLPLVYEKFMTFSIFSNNLLQEADIIFQVNVVNFETNHKHKFDLSY